MKFRYRVRDPLAKEHDGTIEAASRDDARQQLRRDGFRVLDIEEDRDGGIQLFNRRVSKNDIIYMTSQLAIMVDTGITLSVAMASLAEEEENPTLRAILIDLKGQVESGEDFSAALEKYPKYFDQTYLSLVRASEASGLLGEMLERISSYQQKESETRGKVKAAMAYPAVMACVATSVTLFLLIYILPKFEPLFRQKGKELPKITEIMMSLSGSLMQHWYYWLAAIIMLIGGALYARSTAQGRRNIDWMKIHAPLVGPLFRKVAISRSVRTLGTMIASGVSVLEALRLSAQVSGNVHYEQHWNAVVEQVTSGSQIYETLSGNPLFPSMLVQMMRSGEETGHLDVVLKKVSLYYDGEVEMAVKAATSLIEPLLIVVMGSVVGTIACALLLPIFSMGR